MVKYLKTVIAYTQKDANLKNNLTIENVSTHFAFSSCALVAPNFCAKQFT
jgi:hypothetical protein